MNELSGTTGYHKSMVETANSLHRAGYPVTILSFLDPSDGARRALPLWPLDAGVPVLPLQTLAADQGRLLHRNYHPALAGHMGAMPFSFTANQLAVLRQINAILSPDDTVILTSPFQASALKHALQGDERRVRTVLQIHGDYLHHAGLWDLMMEAREVIDRVQTVASGLRGQFVPTFDEDDVVFIPNFAGERPDAVARVAHEGVNVAMPASYQHRKNQLDAVRALSLVEDESVHLTFWGSINPRNPYYLAVRELVEQLQLGERVRFAGFGTEADVYSTADIVLMTSLSEGFGYPLLEAAYNSLPTVTYDFEFGPRDAIEDGKTGFIVPVGDVEQLAERLTRLAADETLRKEFGRQAHERFGAMFATPAVVEQYRQLLGSRPGSAVDLAAAFAADGHAPVPLDAISLRTRLALGRRRHVVTVSSPVPLHDIQIDDGKEVRTPAVHRESGTTRIEFSGSGNEVVSYVPAPGSTDRHYLASTTEDNELEVLPYLRRDASYGAGTPAVGDTIFATSGGIKKLAVRELAPALQSLTKKVRGDVAWKVRQVTTRSRSAVAVVDPSLQSPKETRPPATTSPAEVSAERPSAPAPPRPTASAAQAAPAAPVVAQRRTATGSTGGRAALGSARRLASAYAVSVSAAVGKLAAKPGAPARREIPRHPRFPVSSGVDSFGTPINQPGGVEVRNAGSARRPTVFIRGEYDSLLLRDAVSERKVEPPFGYGELFERVCEAEQQHGLFELTTRDGVHVWELGRSALIIQLAESLGMWGSAPAVGSKVKDEYEGAKRLTTAPAARRVVFDYTRRGQSDYRTAAYRDDETMFVVQPEPEGYPEVTDTNMVYPFHEFTRWRQDWRRRWAHQRVPEIDARPFEEALTQALGIKVDLGDHLRNRLIKFLDERDFWTPVFERVQPEEVLIASSHWWAGISAAAQRSGARVSDIQYALTSRYAPSFWFGDLPRYGASRFYAWSDFWAERTNVYQEHVVVPRQQQEFLSTGEEALPDSTEWDVCVVSQPRVLRRILAFVTELVRERPGLRVVIAPHPAQRPQMPALLAAAGLADKVTIAPDDTLTTIKRSQVSVGCFSTSLWESAALGRPTYVIPVPGHEETLQDVESGLFRLATSPHDLVPFEVPMTRHTIFGH
ncbi:glycosyltransferase [Xylanimonas oleitrophica]|uniref:glycosyltransferase n=1 Tax=Xylanimonas oleitrophica TaxID=2607479 RepID=UPI001FE655E6|nr:glycosyltransferase [Xylanimonas oleitrophica]